MDKTDKLYRRRLLTEKFPIKKEERFLSLIEDIESTIIVDDEKTSSIYYGFNDKCYFCYNESKKHFWISFDYAWSIFEKEYNMKYFEIRSFMFFMVKKHFKFNINEKEIMSEANIHDFEISLL